MLPDPIFEPPPMTEKEAKQALNRAIDLARKKYEANGWRWGESEIRAETFFFTASGAFLGDPLRPPVVAWWIREYMKILDVHGRIIPFAINAVQYDVLKTILEMWNAGIPVRVIILKARQFGISTFVQAFFFFIQAHTRSSVAMIVAHKGKATGNIFGILRRFWVNLTHKPVATRMNKEGIEWAASDAKIILDTAENKEVARSATLHLIHSSELAFWPYASTTRLGMMQTCHDVPGTIVVEESTANGVGGTFYDVYWRAKEGESDFVAKFYPWHWHPEYQMDVAPHEAKDIMNGLDVDEREGIERWEWTVEQIKWRRRCIANDCEGDVQKFNQEYPSYDRQAFLVSGRPVFNQKLVEMKRRECEASQLLFRGSITYN